MLFLWDFWNLLGHCSPQQPGTWTESQNSKLGIETSMVFVLMCTQAWGPQASLELFLTLPPCFSVSLLGRRPFVNDEEDRGFELCFSPTVKGGLWALAASSVQRNMSFLFSTLCGKWGRPHRRDKENKQIRPVCCQDLKCYKSDTEALLWKVRGTDWAYFSQTEVSSPAMSVNKLVNVIA